MSASKIGSTTSFSAVCTIRSLIVGIPSGRSPPPGFGIITLRTGCGLYVFACSSFLNSSSQFSKPFVSIPEKLSWSTPGAPALALANA